MKFRPWLQGAGLAMLYLLPLLALFMDPVQDGFYHQVMPVTSLTRGALLDLCLLTLALGAGFAWLRSSKQPLLRRLLWLCAIFVTAFLAERGMAEFLRNLGVYVPAWIGRLPWIIVAAAVLLFFFIRRYYDLMIKAAEVFLISAGIATVFVVLPQLVYACFQHASPDQAFFSHTASDPWQPGRQRVVWLLFDELSYNQVFDHPQPGISLPAFTRLKQESVSFSQLVPGGDMTEQVIPSLLLGQPVTGVKSNRRGELLWRSSSGTGWQRFDENATLFAAARRQGWETGVVGWYNPYCRILADVLDRCYWTSQEFAGGSRFSRLSSQRSALQNARDALPFMPQIENALHHSGSNQNHKRDYRRVVNQAKAMIADENIRFAFIHVPVPHPPGIYPNPLTGGEDYLGNLILADKTLAELRAAIEKTASAKDTILIASSDHSWRVPMWRNSPLWTQAEERATNGGQFDTRPVLIVHFPGQTPQNAISIDRPVSTMIVHSLLLDMFNRKITEPDVVRSAVQAEPASAGSGL